MWKLTLGYGISQVRINTNPQDGRISNGCTTSLPKNIHMGANLST